ncbi:MAG: PKD domain-containing protein [Pseudomonadales bacterium]
MGSTRGKQNKPGLKCEELEPRILFSAGGLEAVTPLNDQLLGLAHERVLDSTELPSAEAQTQTQTSPAAQPVKQFADLLVAGDESLVNPASPNSEETSGADRGSPNAIAMDAAGNTVVVWSDAARDGSGFGVYAQRFNANGDKVGSEILVNTDTNLDQRYATVAMDDSGRFAVAFTATDGNEEGIYLRRFQADGTAIDEFQLLVNSDRISGSQINPSIAANGAGEMVIAYENNGLWSGIYAQHFDMISPAPGNQLPGTSTWPVSGDSANKPSADINDSGRIVITWEDDGNLYARRYDHNNSTALSGRQDLNLAFADEHTVNVAVHDNGEFAIAYRSDIFGFNGIWARHFNVDGTAQGFATRVNNTGQNASIAAGSDGSYVVVFEDSDGDGNGVFARRYDNNLSAQGGVFQVNSSNAADQQHASVVVDDINNYSIVWSGNGTQAGQEDANGVFKRQFGTAVAANSAPTATNLSTAESYVEDTPLNLTNIVVTDSDNSTTTVTLTLSDLSAGSLSTATAGTVTSTFDAVTGTWVADGAIADVNTLLAGVVFTPSLNYNSTFNIATSVTDGVNPAITGTKVFTATASNDGPMVSNLNAPESYTEDTTHNLTNIVVTDVDSPNITVTLNLSDVAAGSLSTATAGSVTSVFNAISGTWQASGAIADVNTLLANLEFAPALNYNSDFTIKVRVSDGLAPIVSGSKTVTGNAVNDAPIARVTPPAAIAEGGAIVFNASDSTDVDGSIQTYLWDIGADGDNELSTSSSSISLTWDALNTFGITDDGDYQVQLEVIDNAGATDTQTFIVSVNNSAPIVSLAGPSSITVGDTFQLVISANDPGSDSLSNLLIDWGDGNSESISGGDGTYAHVYTMEDTSRVIQVTASDEDGTYAPVRIITAVTPNNPPDGEIVIDQPGVTVAVDDTLTVNNTVSDADGIGSAFSFQWQRDGNDISGANGNSYAVTEADAGAAISVLATYTDSLGNPESVSSTNNVLVPAINQAPSLLLSDTSITLAENTDTSARIALSNVSVLDDGLGSNTLALVGDNADLFEIDEGILYLKAGVELDYETAERLEATIQVDDSAIGTDADDSEAFTLNLEDVDEDDAGIVQPGNFLNNPSPNNPLPNNELEPTPIEAPDTDTEAESTENDASDDAPIENNSAEPLNRLPGRATSTSFIENPDEVGAIGAISLEQASGIALNEQNVFNVNPVTVNAALLEQLSNLDLDDPALRNTLLQLEAPQNIGPMENFDLLDNSGFISGLDDLRLNLMQQSSDQMVIGSSLMATSSLSVGYVIWLIRGSVLLSTLLSSLPAWRLIDPLPVLAGALQENDEDDESLQTILEGEPPPEQPQQPEDDVEGDKH